MNVEYQQWLEATRPEDFRRAMSRVGRADPGLALPIMAYVQDLEEVAYDSRPELDEIPASMTFDDYFARKIAEEESKAFRTAILAGIAVIALSLLVYLFVTEIWGVV